MHDLATTIANSWPLVIFGAGAAGLAALALYSGIATVKKTTLPPDFPADAEAQLDKYSLAFSQLRQAGGEQPESISNLVDKLKNQPAVYFCLTAYQQYAYLDQKKKSVQKKVDNK